MPVKIPERKVAPPGKSANVKMTHQPRTAIRAGYEIEKIGRVISGLGGNMATLALRAQRMQIREEAESAKLEYNQGMTDYFIEQDKNQDFAEWGSQASLKSDELEKIGIGGLKTTAAQNMFREYVKNARPSLVYKRYNAGMANMAANVRRTLRMKTETAAKSGTLQSHKEYIEDMVEVGALIPADIEVEMAYGTDFAKQWNFKQTIKGVRGQLLGILRMQGEEEAATMIMNKKNFPELEANEYEKGDADEARFNMSKEVSRIAAAYQDEFDRQQAEKRKEIIDNIVEKTLKGEPIEDVDIEGISEKDVKEDKRLKDREDRHERARIDELKSKLKEIQDAQGKKDRIPREAVETQWMEHIDLQDKVLKYLLGDGDEENMLVDLLKAYDADQTITIEELNSLVKLSKLDWKENRKDYLNYLKQGYNVIREKGFQGWPWGKSKKEAVAIARARDSLLQWMQNDIARKKDLDLKRVLVRANQLIISAKSGYPKVPGREIYKIPTAPEEPSERALWHKVDRIWWGLKPKMQEQIWADLEAGMTWEQIINKDYEE